MLTLTRLNGERVIITHDDIKIIVEVSNTKNGRCSLNFEAYIGEDKASKEEVLIDREEIYEARKKEM